MKPTVDLSSMTPAQQKRLCDLMMRDIPKIVDATAAAIPYMEINRITAHTNAIHAATFNSARSVDNLLDRIEERQNTAIVDAIRRKHDFVNNLMNRDELFRFAYVPFVIAELAWDYADTVLIMSKGIDAVKKLRRAIINARNDYNSVRRQFINAESREREIENMYVFEDGIKRITNQMLANIDIDIKCEYPELNDASHDLLVSVYQCHVISRALITYTDNEARKLAKRIKRPVGRILPPSYYVMDKLIPEFIGDKPASAHLKNLIGQYIKSISVQIGLVELNDESDDDNASNYHFQK